MKWNPGACTRTSPPVVVTVIDCDPRCASRDESMMARISSADAEGLESITSVLPHADAAEPHTRREYRPHIVGVERKAERHEERVTMKTESGGDADAFVDAGVPHRAGIQEEREAKISVLE